MKSYDKIVLVVPQHPDFYPHIERHAQVLLKRCKHLHIIAIFEDVPQLKLKSTTFHAALPQVAQGLSGFISLMKRNYQLLKEIKPDLVEAIDPPSSIPTACYAKRYNVKWFYFSMEYFSETPALAHKWLKRNVWSMVEKWSVRNSKIKIATVCQSVADCLSNKFNRPVEVVRSIPWLNPPRLSTDLVSPELSDRSQENIPNEPKSLRELIGVSDDKFVLVYQGALEVGRGLLDLPLWIQKHKSVHMVVFGDGPLEKEFIELIDPLQNISYLGRYPFNKMMELSKQADAGIVWIEPLAESYRLSLPGKIFEYIHCGIPVLGSPLPEISRHIKEYDIGRVAEKIDQKSFDEALENLIKYKSNFQNNLENAAKQLSWEEEQKKILNLIDSI